MVVPGLLSRKGKRPCPPRRSLQILLLLVLLVLCPLSVHGAHARKRPTVVVRRGSSNSYDRSITTFDPQGRLPQVTYGQAAAHKGSLILGNLVAVNKMVNETTTTTNTTTNASNTTTLTIKTETLVLIIPSSTQDISSTSPHVHRLQDSIFLVGTGLVGDVLTIAQNLRVWCQNQLYTMGEAPTCAQVAREAARLQHSVTLVPGNRPYGCAVLILGVDEDDDDDGTTDDKNVDRHVHLFSVGPGGGAVHEALCCALGRNHEAAQAQLVQLQQQQEQNKPSDSIDSNHDSMPPLEEAIGGVMAIYREHSRKPKEGVPNSLSSDQEQEVCQVWTFTPSLQTRGRIHVQCHLHPLRSPTRSWGSRVSRWVKKTFL